MIFQAITTEYFGPTNHRPSRIKAKAAAGSLTVEYSHHLTLEANHDVAAKAFAESKGWEGHWHGGGMPNGKGNVYVNGKPGSEAFITVGGR
jgi:hypothetical protein